MKKVSTSKAARDPLGVGNELVEDLLHEKSLDIGKFNSSERRLEFGDLQERAGELSNTLEEDLDEKAVRKEIDQLVNSVIKRDGFSFHKAEARRSGRKVNRLSLPKV